MPSLYLTKPPRPTQSGHLFMARQMVTGSVRRNGEFCITVTTVSRIVHDSVDGASHLADMGSKHQKGE